MLKMKSQKGITLVALVITIAIMLILAGVTISVSLKGGLFSRANEATSQMQIEAEKEQLLTAALGTLGRNGKVNIAELDNNLPEGFTGSNGIYTSSTGNRYQVTQDVDIILLDGTEEEPEEPDTPVTPPATPTITLSTTQITKEITAGTPETVTLTATLNNASGDLTWTSSDTSIAEISGSGTTRTITLKKAGTARITVSYGSASDTCTITVTENVATVDDELAGTWVFNDTLTITNYDELSYNLNFSTIDGLECKGIRFWCADGNRYTEHFLEYLEFETIWDNKYEDMWFSSANQTITISSRLSEVENGEEFLTWLKANATKQSS